MNKLLIIGIIGLLIFTSVYSFVIFNSNFGIPDVIDWDYNYPCDTGYNKYEGGYVFENCYVLDLNWWDNK